MARSGFVTLLLFFGLVVSNVYGDNATVWCEQILNATLNDTSHLQVNLTVSPDKLFNNTDYTVQLHGDGNFTILLQAVSSSGPVGNWSQTNLNCSGNILFINHSLSQDPINVTWTSPDNVTSVTINTYLQYENITFLLNQTLQQESNQTTNPTNSPTTNITEAATSGSTTGTLKSDTTATHYVSVAKTTSAGSVEQSSLVSMALGVILGLFLIPNMYL